MDALQPAPAEYFEYRGSLVYIQSTPPSATIVTHPSFRFLQPRHLHVSMRSHVSKARQRLRCGLTAY